jgi:hypothetical protein
MLTISVIYYDSLVPLLLPLYLLPPAETPLLSSRPISGPRFPAISPTNQDRGHAERERSTQPRAGPHLSSDQFPDFLVRGATVYGTTNSTRTILAEQQEDQSREVTRRYTVQYILH